MSHLLQAGKVGWGDVGGSSQHLRSGTMMSAEEREKEGKHSLFSFFFFFLPPMLVQFRTISRKSWTFHTYSNCGDAQRSWRANSIGRGQERQLGVK